jgi:GMP synthase (glutamine-hydrolysing)
MKRLCIVKTGSTYPDIAEKHGDFEQWVQAGLKLPSDGISVIDLAAMCALPRPDALLGVVITGAHEMVTDGAAWMEQVCKWLRQLVDEGVPILAICYGHQLLARALGGEVGYLPGGREVGTIEVRCHPGARQDPLFEVLPGVFPAQSSHAQSVVSLPPNAVTLAHSELESVHAFRAGDRAWGVQFHPEFTEAVMRCYVYKQCSELAEQGLDADVVARAVTPSPAKAMLERFAALTNA